jgi:hypothetical protein
MVPPFVAIQVGAVLPEAKRRGMRCIAWIEESSYADELRRYPNMPKCLEVDPRGRPVPRMCFNDPDYRAWHLGIEVRRGSC